MKPIAPAFPNNDAFYCRFFAEVGSYTDAAQRRLHEVDFREEEGEAAYRRCPFHDSRKDYLINNAALKQITSEWKDIKQGATFFASLFDQDSERDMARAWRITLGSMFAPLYLFHRASEPYANGSLPTPVSGVFKIMLDVPTTIDLMFLRNTHDVTGLAPKDAAKTIRDFADTTGILLNGDYACAGSPNLIDDINGVLFEDRQADVGGWGKFFSNTEEFKRFSYLMSAQYVIGLMYLMATAVSMEAAFGCLEADGRKPDLATVEHEDRLSAYERRRRIMLDALANPADREAAVTRFFDLVKDPAKWGISDEQHPGLKTSLESTLTFLSGVEGKSPEAISDAHTVYAEIIKQTVAQSQNLISATIGASDLFDGSVRFVGQPEQDPARILRGVVRPGQSQLDRA